MSRPFTFPPPTPRDEFVVLLAALVDLARSIDRRLGAIEGAVTQLQAMEVKQMAIGDDILAKVKEADGKVDSVVAFITALKDKGTIDATTAQAILDTIAGSEAKLDAAIGPVVA